MAIGRVSGPLLFSDLDRQGVDLQFSTNNQPLLYLDFANFRAAINANTVGSTDTLTVSGSTKIDSVRLEGNSISTEVGTDLNLAVGGNLLLGDLSTVKIYGGQENYILTTDGAGNLTWMNITTISEEMHLSGKNVIIGQTTDGSLIDNSAYRYWHPDTTISDAVDNLNQVMLNVYKNTYVGQADFTANVVAGPSPLTVSFQATTVGNPTDYYWEFGDGQTSTVRNPVHTFSNSFGGLYTVYFKARNVNGTLGGAGRLGDGTLAQGSYADVEKEDFITLYTPLPISAFSLDVLSIDSGSTVNLTNLSQYAAAYTIHWGDGTTTDVPSNVAPGGVGGGDVSHTYTNVSGDTAYSVTLSAFSPTAGPAGETVVSSPTVVKVYSTHTPMFIANKSEGNNQHLTLPHGLVVGFTNTTGTGPGATTTFPGNLIRWHWGDGTTTDVAIGSGNLGDIGQVITHAYTLQDPTIEETFDAFMEIRNGHSTVSFYSATWTITVHPAPTSIFEGVAIYQSDRIGDTPQTGYLFTDLLGHNRASFEYFNTSINADIYTWTLGDGVTYGPLVEGDLGSPSGAIINHSYANTGQFSVSLLAHGPSSLNTADDTLLKSNYLQVLAPPAPPAGVGTKTIALSSVGTTPLLAANATDNTLGSIPAAGASVTRITTVPAIETNEITNVYNAASGSLSAVINGTPETAIPLSGANDTGIYGSMVITSDADAHTIDPNTYPSNFYTVFSGKISRANASVMVGYNSYQISHTTTGNTNVLGFVKDDVVLAPTLDMTLASASTTNLGTPRYISGIPYFNTSGTIAVSGITAANWIGQTYLGSTTPMTVTASPASYGSGSVVASQAKTYANLNNSGTPYLNAGIPIANTGKTSGTAYVLGAIPVSINGSVAATGKIRLQLTNVNGASPSYELDKLINVYSTAITGFDETSIPVSVNLGGSFTDNGKRVFIPSASGPNPTFVSTTNYFLTAPFTGAVPVTGTDEATVRFGTLGHDVTNYSQYLPIGPDLSGRAGTQYFRFAFRRSTVANFTLKYSGKISGLMIAAPNTQIDQTSTLNKWLDASLVYAGAGIPGENTSAGGNGSNGCAKSAGDVIPVGQTVTNRSCILTLGSANSSDSTGNTILVSIELAAGDSITAISIS